MVKHVKSHVNVIQQKYRAQDRKDNLVQSPTYLKMEDEYELPTLNFSHKNKGCFSKPLTWSTRIPNQFEISMVQSRDIKGWNLE